MGTEICTLADMQYGWQNTDEVDGGSSNNNSKWCHGTFIENGRIIDGSPNGNLKSMVKYLTDKYPHVLIFTTPNHHLLFSNLGNSEKERFKNDMKIFGYGIRKKTFDATNNNNNGNTSSSKIAQQRQYSKLRICLEHVLEEILAD